MALPLKIAAEEGRSAMAGYAPQSLQAWGRDLAHLGPALADIAAAIDMTARHGEDELPASQQVVDRIREVVAAVQAASSLADEAATAYRGVHEADEDRLENPRKSITHERRADVTAAQDEI